MTALDSVRRKFLTPDLERPFAAYVRRTLAPALERAREGPAVAKSLRAMLAE